MSTTPTETVHTLERVTKHRYTTKDFQLNMTVHMSAIDAATAHDGLVDIEVYTHAELERADKATVQAEKRPNPIIYVTNALPIELRELIGSLQALASFAEAQLIDCEVDEIRQHVQALYATEKAEDDKPPAAEQKKLPTVAGSSNAATTQTK